MQGASQVSAGEGGKISIMFRTFKHEYRFFHIKKKYWQGRPRGGQIGMFFIIGPSKINTNIVIFVRDIFKNLFSSENFHRDKQLFEIV